MRYYIVTLACLFPAAVCAQDAAAPAPVRPSSVSVSSIALQDVGPWGVAALPEGLRPISSDLWRGADPSTLAQAFARLNADQKFPSLQMWVRQAVFSGGTAPTLDPDIARARFDAASRLGPADAAARLIFAVPRLTTDTGLTNIAIDAGLRAGRIDEACRLIEAVTTPPPGTVWQESRATCYALNDEPAAANLSVDLAKTAGLTDTWLSRAVAAVSGPLSAPPPFRLDSGRALALSLRANLRPPLTLTTSPDGAAISALARNTGFMESLAPAEQLALLEAGVSRGVLPVSLLPSAIIKAEPPPPAADPSIVAPPAPVVAPVPAQIRMRILSASTVAGRAMESQRALAEIKNIMATQPGLMDVSDVPVLAEAALWSGDGALAASIAALTPQGLDPRLALVMALYHPANQGQAVDQRLASATSDPTARRLALRDAMVAGAAGVPLGDAAGALVQQGLPWGQAGNAGLRLALDLAGGRGSKGEVILLSALALQSDEVINANPETVIVAVRNLRRVGLDNAARDVARDYLLATIVTLAPKTPSRQRATPPSATAPATRPPPTSRSEPARPTARPTRPPAAAPPPPPPPPPPPRPGAKPSWGTP